MVPIPVRSLKPDAIITRAFASDLRILECTIVSGDSLRVTYLIVGKEKLYYSMCKPDDIFCFGQLKAPIKILVKDLI